MLTTEIKTQLADLPLFNNMTPDEIRRIARGSREIHATRGSLLFHRGDPCVGFHLLLSGQIKLSFTSAQGNEKVVEVIRPGQSFGEALMFMESPYIVDAQALADSHLLHIAKTTLDEELANDPKLARKMLASMAIRLHQMVNDLEAYSLHSGRERIVAYLLRELPPPANEGNSATLALQSTKGVIASRLNLTQEHFSRILGELSGEGLIAVRGREIDVPDIARLRASLG